MKAYTKITTKFIEDIQSNVQSINITIQMQEFVQLKMMIITKSFQLHLEHLLLIMVV